MAEITPLVGALENNPLNPKIVTQNAHFYRVTAESIGNGDFIHTDSVYNALMNAASAMEARLKESLENYQEHPDIQANLQQWNLALTTMTNINKNMGDALNSIASNFR